MRSNVFGEEVAHGALDEIGFFEDATGGRAGLHPFLDLLPLIEQQCQVAHKVAQLLALADGPHDDAHAFGDQEAAEDFLEPLPFLRILNLARDAALVGIGQQHQVAAGQDQVGRHSRSLGADGAFGDLHDDLAAGWIDARDVFLRDLGFVPPFDLAFDNLDPAVEGAGHNVPIMKERVLLEPDVHKGRFEIVLEVAHFAFEDAADQPFLGGPLDVELLEPAFFENGHAGFQRFGVDDDFFMDALDRFDEVLDFFDQARRGRAEAVQDAPGGLRNGHRLEGLFLVDLGGRPELGFAEVAFGGGFRGLSFRGAFGRQANREVFGALDFLAVPALIDPVRARRLAGRLGAGLEGLAIGAWRLGMAQAAAGAEAHAAPPPGKVSFTHS